jgi:hypothetical protein
MTMNDNDLTLLTLEPAITPAFLAQLEQLAQQPRTVEQSNLSWATFLFSALRQRAPRLAPQPQLAQVSPL